MDARLAPRPLVRQGDTPYHQQITTTNNRTDEICRCAAYTYACRRYY